ncbi:helix-turn-helix domain-containing protein [Streptomyces pseudovenezuelae]|uniref:Transcriptional regulator with XRE-family HTH domain n=1 Tax=Streptomyces pseudovenezuelae TaxID=67350 RepID=A0ABT6LF10_9ACTN|nr:helix-turn-helix transcriptional regulator [Streptomyces pseudovenezuelae]MDH6214888.1 transcriptional regulator with XRE-family HTH domain [Streptomyces pseudovenezuelae]
MTGDDFSALLGRLKERSGLSYGVLGKRLHMSASTLHRYVNGDAVPTDYAPVERLARLCRATPEELVELHRQWILADARRGQKPSEATAPAPVSAPTEGVPDEGPGDVPDVQRISPEGPPPAARRRRTVVLAGTAVVAAVAAAALMVNLVPDGKQDDRSGKQSVGAAASESVNDSAAASKPTGAKSKSPSPSASRTGGPTASASATPGAAAVGGDSAEDGAAAPTVAVDPYKWEDPCSQHYLVDRKPEEVPPPPSEPDARGWVKALGGVAAGEQMLALTVQGTGKATVVLESLHVRVVDKSAPLAWNDFEMGVGCGGGVQTASFGVDLDNGRPSVVPKAGQRDFPYKVSESDPEVFYVFADAKAHNVSWYLELEWSSGDKNGVVRVDDKGNPFRTSANVGRPAYNYPLGDSEWGRNEYEPNIPG